MKLNYFKKFTESDCWVPTFEEYLHESSLSIEVDKELGETQYLMEGHKHLHEFITKHNPETVYATTEELPSMLGEYAVHRMIKGTELTPKHIESISHSLESNKLFEKLFITIISYKSKPDQEVAILVSYHDGIGGGDTTLIATQDGVEVMDELLTKFMENFAN